MPKGQRALEYENYLGEIMNNRRMSKRDREKAARDEPVFNEGQPADAERYDDAAKISRDHTCAECDNHLGLYLEGPPNAPSVWRARCIVKEHTGLMPILTATEVVRSNNISAYSTKLSPVAMAGVWRERHNNLTPAACYQAALYSLEVGLDPRFNEVACIQFRQGDSAVTVPTMMITAKGWRTLAGRHIPDRIEVWPTLEPVFDIKKKQEYGAEPADFVCLAHGRLKGDGGAGIKMRSMPGIYSDREYQQARGNAFIPAGKWPLNQAMKRALRHWYEIHGAEAYDAARAAYANVMTLLDTQRIEAVITTELEAFAAPRQVNVPDN